MKKCNIQEKCGGCQLQGVAYEKQLAAKQEMIDGLFSDICTAEPIIGMKNPLYYRNKVHHAFARDKKGNILSGCYESRSHRVIMVEECMLEDKKSQDIIHTIRGMLKSFKITVYDEDRESGLLRHVLVRRGFKTGELMVVLVVTSPIFPSKNNFVKALRKAHPEITTVVLNINDKQTSMVLGERNITLYGPGIIKDELCGCKFRISPASFYQINPVQTEILYNKAIEFAGLTGKETVIDAYCGIGTIGLVAAKYAGKVIGVELNEAAVRDAKINARENKAGNAEFFAHDAGAFMNEMAEAGEHADVVFMDPPRSGSTEEFMNSAAQMKPSRIVYVSCDPKTLVRDVKYLMTKGYKLKKLQGVDMFPFTEHVECVAMLEK